MFSVNLFFLIIALVIQLTNQRLYEPRLDELLQRTASLSALDVNVKNLLKKTDNVLNEVKSVNTKIQPIHKERFPKIIYVYSEGSLHSPTLHDVYPSESINCTWEFVTRPEYRIVFHFTYWNLLYGSNYPGPVFNKVHLQTKINENDLVNHIHQVHQESTNAPLPITTIGNRAILHYQANRLFTGVGFSVTFSPQCEEELTPSSTSNPLFSHYYFGFQPYPHNMDCKWSISTYSACREVKMTFRSFHVGTRSDLNVTADDKALQENLEESHCLNDYVEVYIFNRAVKNLLGRFCGNMVVPENMPLIQSSRIQIRFHSDEFYNAPGFSATYQTVDTC